MINPSDICLDALPSVPLASRNQLPKVPCIYFAINSQGVVQYIGQTICLLNRWVNHHRTKELKNIGGVKIAYLAVDEPSLLREVERALIDWFHPPLNHAPVPSLPRDLVKGSMRATINHKIVIERGGSIAELAEALGVKRGAASNLRRGGCDRLQLKTLVALSEHLGVSIESLLIIEREEDDVEGVQDGN